MHGLVDTGSHLIVSTKNGESRDNFELKEDTCGALVLKDQHGRNTKNELKA